ncbi:hypothetical protein [Sediminitomix flava]|uniref:Uncharacterized protein n=1 Tax=Sediminitomix flava TaxID=379075 RepID=A0A315ZEZ0_SEDFL|nr:hypothetical protein [Sediminitomix flava]PWJ44125.1 hypothetical protein BC781_101475 [Sediminitomix flava]
MAKLKHIIQQLSDNDFNAIYESLLESNAEKSAYLLRSMRGNSVADITIMEELSVNTNAYYTLRSRLNQKIEEYLLEQMESPRTDLLKKVANIPEMIFSRKKTISIATLKKLEKELLDYDLSNELTIVYKTLKRLHLNSPDHYQYSQLYNKHVSYMLAIDKIEDIVADYFKKFSEFALTGNENDRLSLELLNNELNNLCSLYDSHRPYVYKSCVNIFHRLFVKEDDPFSTDDEAPIEDIFDRIDGIFQEYQQDPLYYHLNLVFSFLKLEYYNHFKVYRNVEKYFDEVNEQSSALMSYCNLFTFPSQYLKTKVERHLRTGTEKELYEENKHLFLDYSPDVEDIPNYISYVTYRAICCYYADKFDEAARWINNLLNELSLKKYPEALLEIKTVLALQYCCMRDFDLFNQLVNSIQRQIRLLGKGQCEDIVYFVKMLKTGISEAKKDKEMKINSLVDKYNKIKAGRLNCPTQYIRKDEKFITRLCEPENVSL